MKKIFLLLTFLFFITSCEKKLQDENQNENKSQDENQAQLSVNYYAPFSLYLSNGTIFNMQKTDYGFAFNSGGKPVLFNFIINDCAPCEAQNSYFNKLAKKYEDLIIITVPLEKINQEEALMMKEFGNFKFEVAYGENNFFLAKVALDEIIGIPFSILYDKNGIIIRNYNGLMPPEMLETDIKKVI